VELVGADPCHRNWSTLDLKFHLVVYCFTSRSRIFHLYGDVTITGEGLQNLGLCSALRALEQGGIFIVPHLLRHGTSVFPVSSEGPPNSVASYDTQGDVENLFLPGFSRVPYQSPLTTHKGMWRIYSNPDPHGVFHLEFKPQDDPCTPV
jgi:hypothetical protein